MRDKKLLQLAKAWGAEYVYIDTLSGIPGLFNKKLWSFRIESLKRIGRIFPVRRQILQIRNRAHNSDETIASLYDAEYRSADPTYMFLNELLFREGFEKITGIIAREIQNLKMMDIGAGNNELLRFLHAEFGVATHQLFGADVSPVSAEIIRKDGFQGYAGRIENLHVPENNFDIVFLSYFIDFDTDQKSTFEEAVRITRPGGTIVLEGKFPSNPSSFSEADKGKIKFITKGIETADDIELVCRAFKEIAQFQTKNISVERIVRSSRYVFSRYGLCKLPSYFLVFKITTVGQSRN